VRAEQRWYHTADKLRLVPESDPAGAYLAYAVGDEMPDPEPEAPAELETSDEVEAPKSRRPAANKSRRPQADK
jgi:hypothetical protein